MGFCRAQTGCDPGAVEALGACILRCGAGMTGDEGLAFASARHCLDGLDAHAQCPALEACIPPAVQVDCAEWCGPLEGCGAEPEGCAEACDADPLARLRALTQTACLGAADDDCDAALECIDTSIEEPPPVDAAMYCARYRACGFERELPCDQFLQEFIEDPDEDHWMPCAFAQMDPCPDNPWDPIERCFGGHEAPPELGTCKRLCQAEGFCGSEDSVRVCTETCVNQVRGDPDGPRAEAVRCRDALTCGELAACVAAEVP